ncbi:hypothetical protein KLP28_16460 [Nocardioidaceae bacterium]|nr:hypothetical protein KLP28_16460 [Nocardioidaceae bacterium]
MTAGGGVSGRTTRSGTERGRAPSDRVLDLFAVPPSAAPLVGSRGAYVAGDLVLSPLAPGDDVDRSWLAPTMARLAVRLDEDPGRVTGALRLAVPVPARDGSITVDGWEAHRFEPGTTVVRDPAVVRAAGRLLHARLAIEVRRPAGVGLPDLVELPATSPTGEQQRLLQRIEEAGRSLAAPPSRTPQLVHAGLPGRVLLDPSGSPVVLQVVPAWDLAARADARCVVTAVLDGDAPGETLAALSSVQRTRVLEVLPAMLTRDTLHDATAYAEVLDELGA